MRTTENNHSSTRNTSKFAVVWMIIIVVLLLIIIATWLVLTFFLSQYEKSQPIYSINEYISTIDDTEIVRLCQPITSELSGLQDTSVIVSNMKNSIMNSTPVEYSIESNSDHTVYYLYDGDKFIEKVTLVPGNSLGFGLKKWEVSEADLLTDQLANSMTINIPSDYTLYFDDEPVDKSYISDDKVQYELLKEFYSENASKLPYLCSYVTGDLVGDANIYVKDANGNKLDLDNLSEENYIDNCSDADISSLKEFADNFVTAYVKFLSNSDRNTEGNYSDVMQYVKKGSTLESKLRDAKKSNGYNVSHGDDLESIELLHCMDCGNGIYACDVQFKYLTTGQDKVKTEMTNNMKILIEETSPDTYEVLAIAQY